jgi:hypothetical protein
VKNQTANSLQALGQHTAGANHAILENLRNNRRSTDRSRPLAPNRSPKYANIISPVGDEVALFSAARQSATLATNAFISL